MEGKNSNQKNGSEKKFICEKCGKSYTRRNDLKRHNMAFHGKSLTNANSEKAKADIATQTPFTWTSRGTGEIVESG